MRSHVPRTSATKSDTPTSGRVLREDSDLERAADRIAGSVLDAAAAARGLLGSGVAAAAAPVGGGSARSLPASERSFFESRMGWNFSNVRIHSDTQANARAHELGTPAFTMGSNIFLGAGAPSPGTDASRRLMAHELTHVTQQQRTGSAPAIQRKGGNQPIRPTSTLSRGPDGDTVSIQGIPYAIIRSKSRALRPKGAKRDAFSELQKPEILDHERAGVSLTYTVTLDYENYQDDLTITYLPGRRKIQTTVFPSVDCHVLALGDQSEPPTPKEQAEAPKFDPEVASWARSDELTKQALSLNASLDGLWRQAKRLEFGTVSGLAAGGFGAMYGVGANGLSLGLDVVDSTAQLALPVPDIHGKVEAVKQLGSTPDQARAIGRSASASWDIASGKTNDIYEKTRGPYKKFSDAYSAFFTAKTEFVKHRGYYDRAPHLGAMNKAMDEMMVAAKEYRDLCIELGVPAQAARVDELERAIVTGIQNAPVTVTRALLAATSAGELHAAAKGPIGGMPKGTPKVSGEVPPVVKPKVSGEAPQVARPSTPTQAKPTTVPDQAPPSAPASKNVGDAAAGDRPSGVYPKYEGPTKPPTESQSQAIPVPQQRVANSDVVQGGPPARTNPDAPRAVIDGGGSKPPGKVLPFRREAPAAPVGKPPPAPKNSMDQSKVPETKNAAHARVEADRKKFLESGGKVDVSKVADFETHHLATKYGEAGKRNQVLFENADLQKGVESGANKLSVENHVGPHGPDYNNAVTSRLEKAVAGKTAHTKEYREALLEELGKIGREVRKKGTDLNDLVTKKR